MKVELNHFYNCDCMDLMKELPDKYINLAIVDPPYGLKIGKMNFVTSGAKTVGKATRRDYSKGALWDTHPPTQEYFDELFRVSNQQIIWGGNYFTDKLPPSKSWIVWDKRCDDKFTNDFADCEIAWASKGVARVFRYLYSGMLQQDMKNKEYRFHPTQKPVKLYEWLLSGYAKKGDIILDTHCGSASSLIACYRMGFDYIGCEIDKDYYEKANERLECEKAQLRLF